MSDLQLALLATGVLVLALVWAYNAWQERKHLKAAGSMLKEAAQDALLPTVAKPSSAEFSDVAVRREPQWTAPEIREPNAVAVDHDLPDELSPLPPPDAELRMTTASEGIQVAPESAEPVAAPVSIPEATVAPGASGARIVRPGMPAVLPPLPPQWADSLADCILRFTTPDLIEAAPVWQSQRVWASDLSKPMHWLVFDTSSGYGGSWRCLSEHDRGAYSDWAIALQLVDRRGPVSDTELAIFLSGAQKFVRQMGGEPLVLPDRGETLTYATKLDRFCAEIDIQFFVHIVESTGGSFAGSKLRSVAEAAGMALEPDGLFRARDAEGVELYTLKNSGDERLALDTIRTLYLKDLTLTLDVPRVADAPQAFDRMLATARQLAKALNGQLVDAQRAPLEPPMMGGIRAKAAELQRRMRDGGIHPGSVRALRLFS